MAFIPWLLIFCSSSFSPAFRSVPFARRLTLFCIAYSVGARLREHSKIARAMELQEGDVLMDHPPMTEVEMP